MRTLNHAARLLAELALLALSVTPLYAQPPAEVKREQIGQVLRRPVYRDEIVKGQEVQSELHRLFMEPVMKVYVEPHKVRLEPKEDEIVAVMAALEKKRTPEEKTIIAKQKRDSIELEKELQELRAQLLTVKEAKKSRELTPEESEILENEEVIVAGVTPPERFVATMMLASWKLNRHLHQRFGGGRIRFQQSGIEVIDGFLRWLEAHEQQGDFQITDPQLRSDFYMYWKCIESLDSDEPEEVKKLLLEPDWIPKSLLQD